MLFRSGYYNQMNNKIMGESGKGFFRDGIIKPDILAPGVDIAAMSINNKVVGLTGASAATAIVAGVCALIFQWGIVDKNQPSMYNSQLISYLIGGAIRDKNEVYPDRNLGYGKLDLYGIFQRIAGENINFNVRGTKISKNNIEEYYIGKLYIRINREVESEIYETKIF